ncbi:DgyrCDS9499 [Dimorphilus gyrociliatus]|uniref:non-specific serine/threonine protein kinase n=1 Tax=Dimorphilus gyrociliatus TaxID=2664684 RepID=A0A7I8VYL0_9ANNE|nr:DgyrCDS9499 [Dimorphilus gyrociliatus]
METTTNPFQVFTHGDWIFYDLFEEYSSLISAQRSSIIVPFNVNGDGDVTSNFFFDVIISILQKNLKPNWKPYVLFLGFQQSKIDEKLLDEKIHSLINSKVESLGKLIEKLTSADELSNMEFNDQNNLHNLIGLWELLRKMAENGEKNWKFIDSKKIGNKELWKEIEKSFDKAKEMDASLNYESLAVGKFKEKMKDVFVNHEGFIPLNDIIDIISLDDLLNETLEVIEKHAAVFKDLRIPPEKFKTFEVARLEESSVDYLKGFNDEDEFEKKQIKVHRFPYFKALKFLHSIGEVILFKRFKRDDWIIVDPKWLSKAFHKLNSSSIHCNDDVQAWLYFLQRETIICENAQSYFSNIKNPFIKNGLEILKDIGVVLGLSNDVVIFCHNLPSISRREEYNKDVEGLTQIDICYKCETNFTGSVSSMITYLIHAVYEIKLGIVTFIELSQKRVIFHSGPVEVDIHFDESNILLLSRTLDVDEAPSLLAIISAEISLLIEYALFKSSVFYSKILTTPWGKKPNEQKENSDFFDNNFISQGNEKLFESMEIRSFDRYTLITQMYKELKPSFSEEFTQTKTRRYGNLISFPRKLYLSNINSISFSNIEGVDEKEFFKIEKEGDETIFSIRKDSYSFQTGSGEYTKRKLCLRKYSTLEIKFKFPVFLRTTSKLNLMIYLNKILLERISIENMEYSIYLNHKLTSIDFTYFPDRQFKSSTEKLMPGMIFISKKRQIYIIDVKENQILIKYNTDKYPDWVDFDSFKALVQDASKSSELAQKISIFLNRPFASPSLIEKLKTADSFSLFQPEVLNERTYDKISKQYYLNMNLKPFLSYIKNNSPEKLIRGSFLIPNQLENIPPLLKNMVDLKSASLYPICSDSSDFAKQPMKHIMQKFPRKLPITSDTMKKIMMLNIARFLSPDMIVSEDFYFSFLLPLFAQLKSYFCILALNTGYTKNLSEDNIEMMLKTIETNMKDQFQLDVKACDLHVKVNSPNVSSSSVWKTISDDTLLFLTLSNVNEQFYQSFHKSVQTLLTITIEKSSLTEFPQSITKLKYLIRLDIDGMPINQLPDELSNLVHLEKLSVKNNIFREFPSVIFKLYNLKSCFLNSFHYPSIKGNVTLKTLSDYREEYEGIFSAINLTMKDLESLFSSCAIKNTTYIYDADEKAAFCAKLYKKIPHMTSSPLSQLKNEISIGKLTHLDLSYQSFKVLDGGIKFLKSLRFLDLSHNLVLEEINPEICYLPIRTLKLNGCPSLKTPPREIASKGEAVIMGYMRRLHEGSVECRRTKLMLVGLGGAGKTSLIRKMTQSEEDTESEETLPDVTDGIDIKTWKINSIEYSIWDFAGQEVYYNTHQFFLTNRAIYFLLWNMRSGYEHSGLKFWLSSIACHAPKSPIFIIGSHVDEVEISELPVEDLKESFPQISGFHYVSTISGQGIQELINDLITETIKEKYMDEKIPVAYLEFEKKLINEKNKKNADNLLDIDKVCKLANECGIIDTWEIFQATEFLHELGSIQHFQNEFLKSKIIINPQWIIDVMACLISVRQNTIKDGKLLHQDFKRIWPKEKYQEELHTWLLKLTEEFDLTFPLKGEKASLIPCLLTIDEPTSLEQFFKSQLSDNEIRTKMVFNFDYLPSGLCNRAQVRLYQFSDDTNMWKNGSFLVKNRHRGVLLKNDEHTIVIDARGPQPDNILFLVYDIFKNLIQETFVGVKYDCYISCKECIHQGSTDPCLIPYTRIKRAIDLKIPFLQCTDNFHTLSITELKGMLPPETTSDFDFHLENDVRNLRKLRSQFDTYVVFLFSSKDLNNQTFENTFKIISNEIKNSGVSIKMVDESCESNIQNTILTLKEAKDILFLMSDHFLKSRICKELFLYSKKQLKVKTQIVLMEKSDNWKKDSDVGMLCADDLYINMQNPQNVKSKLVDLMCSLSSLSKSYRAKKRKTASCFISYCWSNSEEAVEKGTKRKEGAIGKVDPRRIKKLLEGEGISCWMDIEQVGQTGLIQDITEGLKSAKVVIACVSDEYVTSKNCQMEFRFAAMTLRLPIIIAVVGTGLNWMRSEIGMLSMDYQKVDLQYCEDNDNEILKFVKEHVKFEEDEEKEDNISETNIDESNTKIKLIELLELIQRKFLKNVLSIHDHHSVRGLPHLPILDLEEGSENDTVLGYRFVFLCECDEGWHLPENFKSLKWNVSPDDEKTTEIIKTWSPYLARVYTLLKETDIPLVALNSNIGSTLLEKITNSCSLFEESDNDQFSKAYISLIEKANDETNQAYFCSNEAYLKKCQMGFGNKMWLCAKHQKQPRVRVLDGNVNMDSSNIFDKYYEDMLENFLEDKKETSVVNENTAEIVGHSESFVEENIELNAKSNEFTTERKTSRACVVS